MKQIVLKFIKSFDTGGKTDLDVRHKLYDGVSRNVRAAQRDLFTCSNVQHVLRTSKMRTKKSTLSCWCSRSKPLCKKREGERRTKPRTSLIFCNKFRLTYVLRIR